MVVLNGRFSSLISLILFVFVGNSIRGKHTTHVFLFFILPAHSTAFVNVTELERQQALAIVTGVCEFMGWFSLLCFVVMQVNIQWSCAMDNLYFRQFVSLLLVHISNVWD